MKSIVIYFSRADENYSVGVVEKGNTEVLAEYIHEFTNADMFKVERVKPYPKTYKEACDDALAEQKRNELPELINTLSSIDEYDVIYIGCPIYWGTLPQPMFTQISKLNWNGKIVKPFTTHEGSGLGHVIDDLKLKCSGATIKDGLAIYGHDAINSKEVISEWINK